MRALFEDRSFYGSSFAGIEVRQVNLPQNSNRRDIWIRVFQDPDTVHLTAYVYLTRSEAETDPVLDTYIASSTFTVSTNPKSVNFIDNAANSPDMTGLSMSGLFSTLPVRIDDPPPDTRDKGVVWGYDSAPDTVTADNIRLLLLAHSGPGQMFDGLKARNVTIMDAGRVVDMVPFAVNIVPGSPQMLNSDGPQKFAFRYPFTIQIATNRIVRNEPHAKQCRRIVEQIRALLCGDHRQSYGEAHVITHVSTEIPQPMSGREESALVCDMELAVDYRNFWRDDQNPRG